MTDLRIRAGDILARKYRVERVLGEGGMGVVVAAVHVDLGHPVALKMMLPDKEHTPEMRERFLREARAAVRLKSQHVAKVLDVGTDEHDLPFIAMEYLDGKDLHETLKKQGPLSFESATEYVLQACEAVGEAHAAGIVHRDLKPANMFLTRDVSGAPCVKVLDFGISKLMGAELALTQETQALGSPLYMSPEAMGSAKNVDARTDIWALGIILFQLVAGRTPFHASTMAQLCTRVLTDAPTPLAEYRQDAPPGFEAVIHKCLQRNRDDRYANLAEFALALAPFAPARARMYVERIARIMGVDLAALGLDPSELQATMPLSSRARPVLPSVPAAGATSQAAVVMPSSSGIVGMDAPAKPKNYAPIIVGAALAVIVPGIFLATRFMDPSPTETNVAPSASAVVAAPPVVLPVEPTITTAQATTSASSTAKDPTTGTSKPPANPPAAPAKPTAPTKSGATTTAPAPTKTTDYYDERK